MRLLSKNEISIRKYRVKHEDYDNLLALARKIYGPHVVPLDLRLAKAILKTSKQKFYGLTGQTWSDGREKNIKLIKILGFGQADDDHYSKNFTLGDDIILDEIGFGVYGAEDATGEDTWGTGSGSDPVFVFLKR